jgi:hypothetical protein
MTPGCCMPAGREPTRCRPVLEVGAQPRCPFSRRADLLNRARIKPSGRVFLWPLGCCYSATIMVTKAATLAALH